MKYAFYHIPSEKFYGSTIARLLHVLGSLDKQGSTIFSASIEKGDTIEHNSQARSRLALLAKMRRLLGHLPDVNTLLSWLLVKKEVRKP